MAPLIDAHTALAAKMFGVPYEKVTATQRAAAKLANYNELFGVVTVGSPMRTFTHGKR